MDTASLGDYATMEVPAGYQFIGAADARALLERMNNPAAPGLLGVLVPADGKWLAVLEFEQIGFVKDLDEKHLDLAAVLKAVQNRHDNKIGSPADGGALRIASVQWQLEPKYDAAAHSLEWAFLAETPSGKVINHKIALFGRRGVLDMTLVQPYQNSQGRVELVPLGGFVKKIAFKEHQRYTAYQQGDKIASIGMQEIIVGQDDASAAGQHQLAAAGPASGDSTWIYYSGIGGCAALGIGFVAYKKLKAPKMAAATAGANGHGLPALEANGKVNGKKNGAALKRNGAARHKVFNYTKFYSDMVMQLSGSNYGWVTPAEGHSRPRAAAPASPQPPAPTLAAANAHQELISCQKNLIDEQRNLMREQTRIIEEKARLIKEYTHLVERLSQDVENQFSLKLD